MKELYFLLKTNKDDRDCVKYLEIEDFKDFYICGACFCNIGEKEQQEILNNYENITTALTKEELFKLFEISNIWFENRTSEHTTFLNNIKNKLKSDLNKDLFMQVQEEEKNYLYNEYSLDYNDIEDIFDHYTLEYRDRSIISCVWADAYQLGENYINDCENIPQYLEAYIDYEQFGKDMVENDYDSQYIGLEDGRIVELYY